jgi:hypothetical protein
MQDLSVAGDRHRIASDEPAVEALSSCQHARSSLLLDVLHDHLVGLVRPSTDTLPSAP